MHPAASWATCGCSLDHIRLQVRDPKEESIAYAPLSTPPYPIGYLRYLPPLPPQVRDPKEEAEARRKEEEE